MVRFDSCEFVDRSAYPQNKARSAKPHEPNTKRGRELPKEHKDKSTKASPPVTNPAWAVSVSVEAPLSFNRLGRTRGKKQEMKTLGKLKTLGLATALTGAAVAGSIVVAQTVTPNQSTQEQGQQRKMRRGGRGGDHHGFGGMRGDRLFSQLNLTEDQKAKVKHIHQNFAERNKPLRQEMHAKRQELQQARQGDTFNESLATQKLSEMAALEAKLMGERFRLHQEMLSILTPEQKTQLEQAKAQFKTRRGNKPGRGERRINQ